MGPIEINRAINLFAAIAETLALQAEIRKAEADPIAALTTAAIIETIETHHERGIA